MFRKTHGLGTDTLLDDIVTGARSIWASPEKLESGVLARNDRGAYLAPRARGQPLRKCKDRNLIEGGRQLTGYHFLQHHGIICGVASEH